MRYLWALAAATAIAAAGEMEGLFRGGLDHPAIQYAARPTRDTVAVLNREIQAGKVRLRFDQRYGYLPAVLEALQIPVESQMLVYSKTSVQARLIHPRNPRALYFNDSVVVGFVRGGPILEVAAQDPEQGTIFYTIHQSPGGQPAIQRENSCLGCHESLSSLGVPGMLLRSVHPAGDGVPVRPLGEYRTDHRSPMEERWGGWYVSGSDGGAKHMGNAVFLNAGRMNAVLSPEIAAEYLVPHSDIVALSVFEHQMHMMNLLTRAGWEARIAPAGASLEGIARELVDYLLFIDEPPLTGRIGGGSGFAEKFAAVGPRDSKGRGLRQFDLTRRLMRYSCSYMIYSAAFDALPAGLKTAIYSRLRQVLSGEEKDPRYARLTAADRRAVMEILKGNKNRLSPVITLGLLCRMAY